MTKKYPKRYIVQPSIPSPSVGPYFGQNFPTLTRDTNLLDVFSDPLRPGIGNSPSVGGGDGSGNHDNGFNGYTPKNQNDKDATYAGMLNHNATDAFSQFLASLGIKQDQGLTGSQRDAWNNYLLQTQIQQYLEQNSRDYNRWLQLDQRIYDSPTNQLARLMGAGISRDAAIQLLSGGAGSGSASPIAGSAAGSGDMAAANQAGTLPFQNAATVFSSIAQMAGAIGSLGSFGLSAASLATNLAATKAATAGQLLSNSQLSKTLNGIETASTVVGAISSAYQAGIIDKDHDFSSSQDMLKYIRDNADKFEPFSSLVSSGALDGIAKDVYSLDALNHAYSSWRKTKDYNIDRKHLVRMQSLSRLQANVDYEKTCSEIQFNSQSIQESIARVINDNIRVSNETYLAGAQIDFMGAQAEGVRLDNRVKGLDADWYEANIEDINQVRLGQLMLESAEWNQIINDPDLLKKEVTSWLSNRDNARTAVALESIYLSEEYQQQLAMNDPRNAAYNARQTALYFHNLFNFALGYKGEVDTDAIEKLGKLGKTGVGMFLFKRPMP